MAKIPMGNFGNAMPQTGHIQMPQSNLGQLIHITRRINMMGATK